MNIIEGDLPGVRLLFLNEHADKRGGFTEIWKDEWGAFLPLRNGESFVQQNISRSVKGVVRGMHFHGGVGSAKLVRVTRGLIRDAVINLHPADETFLHHEMFRLSEADDAWLYVPPGYAHGFEVVTEFAEVHYMQTAAFRTLPEHAIDAWDPMFDIEWQTLRPEAIMSKQDRHAPKWIEVAGDVVPHWDL